MDTPKDLNNEKVLMRKQIKKAKDWVIAKLVRQIKNLENKKGNAAQVEKNRRRASRLVEEMDLIKDMKSDDIFKQLLNTSLEAKELAKLSLSLQEKALTRIGSVKFIRSRMMAIKANVSAFQSARSSKRMPAFDQNNENLYELDKDKKQPMLCLDDKISHDGTSKQNLNELSKTKAVTTSMDEISQDDYNTSETAIRDDSNHNQSTISNKVKSHHDSIGQSDDDLNKSDARKPGLSSSRAKSEVEEMVIGSQDGYSIVIPIHAKKDCSDRIEFNEIAKGAEDVTEVLKNIGADFDSEESDNESDLDIEDLAKPSGAKNALKSGVQDAFFLDTAGKSRKPVDQIKSQETVSDDEGLQQVKSCFVESLASVSHQRNKGKNRMSQRARKRLGTKNSENGSRVEYSSKPRRPVSSTYSESRTKPVSQAVESKPLHPSWEASKKRKQAQSSLQEFKGRRVCFDDSD